MGQQSNTRTTGCLCWRESCYKSKVRARASHQGDPLHLHFIFAAWVTAVAVSAHANPGGAPVPAQARAANPGALYHNYCSVCHGDRGDGRSRARASLVPPPRDFTDPRATSALTREQMIAATRDGKRGTAMVGWKTQLRDAEIAAVVDYIRAEFMRPDHTAVRSAGHADLMRAPPAGISGTSAHAGRTLGPAVAVDMGLPLPKRLKGRADRGARFYAANCATCHGALGDGQGPRAYFINPKPRNFVDPAVRIVLNRPALFAAIAAGKPGTEMPAWNKVIDDQTIGDVAEYVFRTFIRAEPAAGAKRSR